VRRQLLAPVAIAALALAAGACSATSQGTGHPRDQHSGASAQSQGTVTGKLEMEGGPVSPRKLLPRVRLRPIPGSVRFTLDGRQVALVRVGLSGRFSVRLPPGTYDAVGRSPKVEEARDGTAGGAGGQQIACSQPARVVVAPRHTVSVVVACIVP
jgi:hypothetical protein